MSVYWAALPWTLPALSTKEDVTGSPLMSRINMGFGMSSPAPGIQPSSINKGVQATCRQGNWWSYLFPSSAQVFMPYMSTVQRRKIENWWTSVRSKLGPWGEKKNKPLLLLLLLEDEMAKKYNLYMPESSNVCSHSGLGSKFFGVSLRTAWSLHKDDLCHSRQCYHFQKEFIIIQGSEELLRNNTIL